MSDILIYVEEVVVVQAAANAFCAILPLLSPEQIDKKALPLIRKLHEGDNLFTTCVTVAKWLIIYAPSSV